jgi:hypothetical protein
MHGPALACALCLLGASGAAQGIMCMQHAVMAGRPKRSAQ